MSGVESDLAVPQANGIAPGVRPLHAAVVGVSTSPTCGVRDHALLLAAELSERQVPCTLHWLSRTDLSISGGRSEIGEWTGGLAGDIARGRPPHVVLLHYSVFSYSYRGLPLFVPRTLSALHDLGIPIVTVLHEYAYPWGRGGVRGAAWAVTQRAALIEVMRASSAVVVTADFRAAWLAARPWLPKRRAVVAPVFSNLPPPSSEARREWGDYTVGLFGYSYDGAAVSLVLDAVRLLKARGVELRLSLLGAPDSPSPAADAWLELAHARGVAGALSFSGVLAPQALSDALAACDVLLSADPSGPTPRKTTLAASLASGRPVVALDGPRSWPELTQSDAALVVTPAAGALTEALASLLESEGLRESIGARGAAFADQAMGIGRNAEIVAALLGDVVARR